MIKPEIGKLYYISGQSHILKEKSFDNSLVLCIETEHSASYECNTIIYAFLHVTTETYIHCGSISMITLLDEVDIIEYNGEDYIEELNLISGEFKMNIKFNKNTLKEYKDSIGNWYDVDIIKSFCPYPLMKQLIHKNRNHEMVTAEDIDRVWIKVSIKTIKGVYEKFLTFGEKIFF